MRTRAYAKDYVSSCQACERAKPRRHAPHGLLGAEAPPEGPWEDLTLDFVTDLAPSTTLGQTYDSILVLIDRFTKMAHYIPCRKDITAEGLAEVFLREILRPHGVPKSIVSDRGPILNSKFWSTLCFYLGVRLQLLAFDILATPASSSGVRISPTSTQPGHHPPQRDEVFACCPAPTLTSRLSMSISARLICL